MKTIRHIQPANLEAAAELDMFARNNEETYRRSIFPTVENMIRKMKRGTFDADKAVKAFEHVAEYAARRYAVEFGGVWYTMFTPATRRAAAESLCAACLADVQ